LAAREVAVHAALEAGQLLRERVDSIKEVRHKSVADIVTDVDVLSEQLIRRTILEAFPTHSILGEEGGNREGSDPTYRWIVDPLDGTTNYAHGFPFFCVSIALEANGRTEVGVVYAPYLNELFVASRGGGATLNDQPIRVSRVDNLPGALLATGFPYSRERFHRALRTFEVLSLRAQAVRRAGSAALDLCYVACGRFDAYWEHVISAWDVAAGTLIVAEAGGRVTASDCSPFQLEAGDVLASNGLVHDSVVEALASA
jgi:myo-inositol-1(or 4)-monophosphatase